MEYKILNKTEDECFIEIIKDTFRTRIEFDWVPEENFKGVAVCCNYHFMGNPVGFIKDNGLVRSKNVGNRKRPLFVINDTIIQAGPTLISNCEMKKDYISEGFHSRHILSGFHAHIGVKKSGNYVLGFTKKTTFVELVNKYAALNVENAIKLPGYNKGMFLFQSTQQTIKEGLFPCPSALIFESRLNYVGDLLSEVPQPILL